MELNEIESQLKQAAGAIASVPVWQWVGWFVRLLEILEGREEPYHYTWFLEELRNAIDRRLAYGQW